MKLERFIQSIPYKAVVLAPLAGISDVVFRVICKEHSCDFTYTEMVSSKGLHYKNDNTISMLAIDSKESPCGVQLFGNDPAIMAQSARDIVKSNKESIAVIDINMGCPAPKITKNGEGSALMKTPELAAKIIKQVSGSVDIPVTVKFRKGWDDSYTNAVEFALMAQDSGASAICVHGRTRMQFYHGKADWDIIAEVVDAVDIPVIGNGDVFCAKDATDLMDHTKCHAVMVARGAQGNPWIFSQIKSRINGSLNETYPSPIQRIDMALEHTRRMIEYKGERTAVKEMRKHVPWYTKGIQDAAKIRAKINTALTYSELENILMGFRAKFEI